METEKSVKDGKMTNEQLGGFHRRVDEIKRRVNEDTLQYNYVMSRLQLIIQDQLFGDFKIATASFDPVSFIGKGWKDIAEERDEKSSALKEVDLAKAKFVSCLRKGEASIKGEEKLLRLKESNDIRLGATVFMGLWKDYQEKKEDSVLECAYQASIIGDYIDFFGNILLDPNGDRDILYLGRDSGGDWGWGVDWLGVDWSVESLSAVFPQV